MIFKNRSDTPRPQTGIPQRPSARRSSPSGGAVKVMHRKSHPIGLAPSNPENFADPESLAGSTATTMTMFTPSHFIPNLTDPVLLQQLRNLRIALAIGELDPFVENNRLFSQTLWDKGIWHAFYVWWGKAHGL